MPKPRSRTLLIVGAAAVAAASIAAEGLAQQAPAPGGTPPVAATPPTPRMPDGHPDLTGLWVAGGPGFGTGGFATGADEVLFPGRGGTFAGFEQDGGLLRTTMGDRNLPKYKPEYWSLINENEYNGNEEDPANSCMPNGLPRGGAPAQIFAIKDQPYVVFLYAGPHRLIPTDGRPHNTIRVAAETWNGDSVGHWEGDTLVIETVGFTDASWMHKNGYIHGFDLKVTERVTRTGNTLRYEVTAEDPEYLTEPWKLAPVTRQLNTNPEAVLLEPNPCIDRDRDLAASHTRSG